MSPSRSSTSAPALAPAAGATGHRRVARCGWLLLACFLSHGASAQEVPAGAATTHGSRLTVAGEASVSAATEDDAYFTYSSDAYGLLRLARLDGSAVFRLGSRLSLLGDVRVQGAIGEGHWRARPYALFARVRPWPQKAIDIQAGLIPPVFGAFSRRAYGTDNPLIGFPLGYQYLTSLRPDALPASADGLLARRGQGWRVRYPLGNASPDHGVPLVDGLRYPVGVEVHAVVRPVEVSAAVTTGSLSIPDSREVGRSPQVSGRIAVRPTAGLLVGASAARGTFFARSLAASAGSVAASGASDQRAVGFDAEYSRGYWLVRAEGILSNWRLPQLDVRSLDGSLRAFAFDVEGRYRIRPGLYAALRLDRLDFSEVCGSAACLPWDAPVRRVEVGGGYSIQRNVTVKAVYQQNWRNTTVRRVKGLASAQLVVWF